MVIALGFLVFIFYSGGKDNNTTPIAVEKSTITKPVKVLKIKTEIKDRSYNPGKTDIPLGMVVELTVVNKDNERHNINIQKFGVTDFVAPLSTKTVRFTADKLGETTTFCASSHPEKFKINVI